MALKDHVIITAFAGETEFMNKIARSDGAPSRTTDFMGQLVYDYTNDDVYINITNTTTWQKTNY